MSRCRAGRRLAAVRRLAYEASDTGLLSPKLAADIRCVKGAKRQAQPIGVSTRRFREDLAYVHRQE